MNSGINFGCWNKKLIKLIIENRTSKYDGNSSQIQIWILVPFPTKTIFRINLAETKIKKFPNSICFNKTQAKSIVSMTTPLSLSSFLLPVLILQSQTMYSRPTCTYCMPLLIIFFKYYQVRACLGPYKSCGKITYLALSNFLTVIQLLLKNQYEKILKL